MLCGGARYYGSLPPPMNAIPWSTLTFKVLAIAGVFGICAGLHLGHAFFVPLALAILLSLILSPLVTLGERLRLPRTVSVLALVVLVFGMLGLAGFLVVGQAAALGKKLPEYRSNALTKLSALRVPLAHHLQKFQEAVKDLESGGAGTPPKEDARPQGAREPVKVEVQESAPKP